MELTKLPSYTIREVKQTDTKGNTGQTLTVTLEMAGLMNSTAKATVPQLYAGQLAVILDPSPSVKDTRPGKVIFAVADANLTGPGSTTMLDDGRSVYIVPTATAGRYDVMDRDSDDVMATGLTLAEAKWEQGYHMGHRDAEAGR